MYIAKLLSSIKRNLKTIRFHRHNIVALVQKQVDKSQRWYWCQSAFSQKQMYLVAVISIKLSKIFFLNFPLLKKKYSEQLISLTTDQVKMFAQTNFGRESLSRRGSLLMFVENLEKYWKILEQVTSLWESNGKY